MRAGRRVVQMGQIRNAYRALVGKPERKRPLGRLDVGGSIILKWILKKWDVRMWTRFMWSGKGLLAGLYERGNEPFEFHKRQGIS
jgi:hypothetical protein